MKKSLWLLFVFMACLTACKDDVKTDVSEEASKDEVVYDMYKPSEMAILMNQMYAHNLKIKQDILNGDIPTEFPINFMDIHSAELTKANQRNETFEKFSKIFITAEKDIFNQDSEAPLEARFNTAVNACISCHETSCTGPIPRIKKLLIKS
ncbi:hypothetical protein [Mangrovimonas spongiae]|uniref:Cytochrome c n=1 Tax=Mangrovimonas spongiae TaxID=2494697 RepID=A0A428K2X0_9FLAO|nr:hypothetical protein [Mangrovimonas spongiae]RSK40733.1 hypothetical protein EJA19_07070 [Mangrovimonas spongiae]